MHLSKHPFHSQLAACMDTYPMQKQLDALIEEIGELMTEIIRYKRGRSTLRNITIELVDVRMMLDVIENLFGIDPNEYTEVEAAQYDKMLAQLGEYRKSKDA